MCYTPHAAGNYLFQAVYSGDANYNPSQSMLCSEPLCVERAPSYTSTCLGTADITLGPLRHRQRDGQQRPGQLLPDPDWPGPVPV